MVVMIKGGLLLFPLHPWRFLGCRNNLWLTDMNWQSLMKNARKAGGHAPFRSRFLAPVVVCVVTLVSILTVWRLLVSLEMITLCQLLSLSGLLELPLIRWAPFPKSDT